MFSLKGQEGTLPDLPFLILHLISHILILPPLKSNGVNMEGDCGPLDSFGHKPSGTAQFNMVPRTIQKKIRLAPEATCA